jgi:hypothetical protein
LGKFALAKARELVCSNSALPEFSLKKLIKGKNITRDVFVEVFFITIILKKGNSLWILWQVN